MRYVYEQIDPAIQCVYLIGRKELTEVSSSLVKGLVGADPHWQDVVKKYVPEPVFRRILGKWEATQ
jgi:pantetheine-phosphate adenylyltransferase